MGSCKAEMLIRSPVSKVFEAFVDPANNVQVLVQPWKRQARSGKIGALELGDVRVLKRSKGQGTGAEQENSRQVGLLRDRQRFQLANVWLATPPTLREGCPRES
jgi:hypothetical protein